MPQTFNLCFPLIAQFKQQVFSCLTLFVFWATWSFNEYSRVEMQCDVKLVQLSAALTYRFMETSCLLLWSHVADFTAGAICWLKFHASFNLIFHFFLVAVEDFYEWKMYPFTYIWLNSSWPLVVIIHLSLCIIHATSQNPLKGIWSDLKHVIIDWLFCN